MAKLIMILLIGLVFEATGVVLLKQGISRVGEIQRVSPSEILRVVKAGATSPRILLGVFFEALFFACLLILIGENQSVGGRLNGSQGRARYRERRPGLDRPSLRVEHELARMARCRPELSFRPCQRKRRA